MSSCLQVCDYEVADITKPNQRGPRLPAHTQLAPTSLQSRLSYAFEVGGKETL